MPRLAYAPRWMRDLYTLAHLESLPTLSVGQTCNLKADDGEGERVWLSRCGVEDGEPYAHKVTIETLENGRWVTSHEFPARKG